MAHVLITGAGGFLGTHLTREFLEQGHQVRAADLERVDLQRHEQMGATTAVCDVTDPAAMDAATRDIEIVVHAAGIFDLSVDPDLLWSVNAEGAGRMATIAAGNGARRFVMISSTSVYGRGVDQISEEGPKLPRHAYDRSKWAGEENAVAACAEAGLPCAVLRPTLIYGPGGRYGVASALALLSLRSHHGLTLLPVAEGGPLGHMVHVEDVARAAVLVATAPDAVGKAFNVADDVHLPAGDLFRLLGEISGVYPTRWAPPWWTAALLRLLKPLVRWIMKQQNQKLAHLWGKLVSAKELVPALQARIDVDWLDYVFFEHTFDNRALKALGFEYRYPDSRVGMRSLGSWYKEQRWLPEVAH